MNLLQNTKEFNDLKILYVENNIQLKNKLISLLENISPFITTTDNLQKALSLYEESFTNTKHYYDIVIINYDIPTATSLIQKIKEINRSQVIALLTQNRLHEDEFSKVINLNIDTLITQPLKDVDTTQLSLLEIAKKSLLLDELSHKEYLLQQKERLIDENIFLTITDNKGTITYISQAYLDFTGYKKEEIVGKNQSIFKNKERDNTIIQELWQAISTNGSWEGDLKNTKSSGEEYWVHIIISPLYDKNEQIIGYSSIAKDITYQKRLEYFSTVDPLTSLYNKNYFNNFLKSEYKRATWREEKFALLLMTLESDSLDDETIKQTADFLQKHRDLNNSEIFAIAPNEFAITISNSEDEYIEKFTTQIIEKLQTQHLKVSIGGINLDTSKYFLNCDDLYSIADENLHKAQNKLPISIQELQIDEYAIKNLKSMDRFTKLPNHTALYDDLSLLHNEAMLIILHVNQLNTLKELYGNAIVKEILQNKAHELQDIIHDEDTTLYNLNLQEFAILITNKNLFAKYLLLLEHSLLTPNELDESESNNAVVTDFCAGVAYGIENLLSHANLALQETLLSHKKFKVYKNQQSLKDEKEEKIHRLKIYKTALYNGDIIPYFQPIVDAKTTQIVKYEALARIQTQNGEILSPYYFLDAAKEDKTFEYFTRQIMQKVFNIYAKNEMKVSINVSYENLNSETMIAYIKNRLDKYGGQQVTFEILESENIDDYSVVDDFILMVKQYGCKVAIDDFGSGYSNFTNILRLHLDYIKLDGSLITQLNKDENINNMVRGIVQYAQQANIKTIAEFVSSQELAQLVKEFGVDLIQGYYYGEPHDPKFYGLNV